MGSSSRRQLTLFDATMLVMGGIIGVGIFFKPTSIAQLVPHTGAYFAIWVFGAVAALAGAMTFAELAGSFPRAGGWYVFLRESFGRLPAFLFAWIVLLVISTGASAGVADFCAQQLLILLQVERPAGLDAHALWPLQRFVAAGLILAISGLACTGVKSGAVFQNLCMLAKLVAIGAFVLGGLAFFSGAPAQPLPTAAAARPLAGGMIAATLPVLFTFGGWQLVTYIAPEVKDPGRTLPKAIVFGVLGVAGIYLLLNGAYIRVLGIGGVAELENVPLELALRTLGTRGATFLTAAMAVSATGFLVATLIATPGIYVAMAEEGLFVRAVGRTHPRTGAPILALTIQATLCCVYLALHGDVIGRLGDSVVFGEWIFHLLCGLALLRMRRTRPDLPRPFRSPLYPFFPVLYALLAAGVVVGNLIANEPSITFLGLGVLGVGLVVYFPWTRRVG